MFRAFTEPKELFTIDSPASVSSTDPLPPEIVTGPSTLLTVMDANRAFNGGNGNGSVVVHNRQTALRALGINRAERIRELHGTIVMQRQFPMAILDLSPAADSADFHVAKTILDPQLGIIGHRNIVVHRIRRLFPDADIPVVL